MRLLLLAIPSLLLLTSTHVHAGEKKQDLKTLLKQLSTDDEASQWEAAMALEDFGPKAGAAAPRLIELLQGKSETMSLASAITLGKIGKDAVPPLIKLLDHKDARVRFYACWGLGAAGPAAKDAVPALLRELAKPADAANLRRAALALGQIRHAPGQVVPALFDALNEIGDHRESGILDAIARFGADAVPYLDKPLSRSDRSISLYATMIAGRIGPAAKEHLPRIEKQLAMSEAGNEALNAMIKIGPASAPHLRKHLDRGPVEWQIRIVDALAEINAWDDVADAIDAKSPEVRRRALARLDATGSSDQAILAAIMHALGNSDRITSAAAHDAIARRGKAAKRAIPALVEAFFAPGATRHARSLHVLRALEHDPLPDLRKQLDAKDPGRAALAGFWLVTQFDDSKEASLKAMRAGVDRLQGENQRDVAKVLAFRREKGKVIPILVHHLKTDPESEERFRIIQALYPLAEVDDDAIRAIALVLRDPAADLRADAARFLGGLAPRSHIELPALRKALQDPVQAVRDRASEAIGLIEAKKKP